MSLVDWPAAISGTATSALSFGRIGILENTCPTHNFLIHKLLQGSGSALFSGRDRHSQFFEALLDENRRERHVEYGSKTIYDRLRR